MKDPIKQQLFKDIRDYRDEKKPRAPNTNKEIIRKILYAIISLSILGSLIRIIIVLFTR